MGLHGSPHESGTGATLPEVVPHGVVDAGQASRDRAEAVGQSGSRGRKRADVSALGRHWEVQRVFVGGSGRGCSFTIVRSIDLSVGSPQVAISRASSVCSSSSNRCTPSAPYAARPHITGRPKSTPCAPSASAFRMSLPRRNPPSMKMGALPPTASTIAGSISIRTAPALLETMMPCAPCLSAPASAGLVTPLKRSGAPTVPRRRSIDFQSVTQTARCRTSRLLAYERPCRVPICLIPERRF